MHNPARHMHKLRDQMRMQARRSPREGGPGEEDAFSRRGALRFLHPFIPTTSLYFYIRRAPAYAPRRDDDFCTKREKKRDNFMRSLPRRANAGTLEKNIELVTYAIFNLTTADHLLSPRYRSRSIPEDEDEIGVFDKTAKRC